MTHFHDLTPYTYSPFRKALNVGWLGEVHQYPTGPVPDNFMAQLDIYFGVDTRHGSMGFHVCDLCFPGGRYPDYGERHNLTDEELEIRTKQIEAGEYKYVPPWVGDDRFGTGEIYVFGWDGAM